MELRRDVLAPITVLLGVLTLVSFGSIGLLSRMAPAIEQILEENVYSLAAIEQMLAVAAAPKPGDEELFSNALQRAENNITEDNERQVLDRVRGQWRTALSGDVAARQELIIGLLELGEINRDAMQRADDEAKRLGYAGAWAMVFLAAAGFSWTIIATRRLRRRVIAPLGELISVVEAQKVGDPHRRCRKLPCAAEIATLMDSLDYLLDQRTALRRQQVPLAREHEVADRAALLFLLERLPRAAFVMVSDGHVEAANERGLDQLHGEGGRTLRQQLRAATQGQVPEAWEVAELGEQRWLIELGQ